MNFTFPIRVYYEDTDFSGIVYHARYLHFCERARTEALRSSGIWHTALLERDDPLVFAIRSMNCDWIQPAKIDDALTVETRFDGIKGARFHLSQQVSRNEQTLFKATVEAVCLAENGAPRRVPEDVKAKLLANAGPEE